MTLGIDTVSSITITAALRAWIRRRHRLEIQFQTFALLGCQNMEDDPPDHSLQFAIAGKPPPCL